MHDASRSPRPETPESLAMHRRALAALNAFMKMEAAGGIVLVLATVVAMVVANSALAGDYQTWLQTHFRIGFGHLALDKSVSHWINDGLMVVFFLVVGMELKRELVEGQFSDRANITLPVIGAIGGMAVPMLIYAGLNAGDPAALHGRNLGQRRRVLTLREERCSGPAHPLATLGQARRPGGPVDNGKFDHYR
jgi:NhaA family Na+:H+ antiporter